MNKVLVYGIVGAMLLALVGGTGYILARPAEAETQRGGSQSVAESGQGWGQGRGNSLREADGDTECGGGGESCQGSQARAFGQEDSGAEARGGAGVGRNSAGTGVQGRSSQLQQADGESVSAESWVEITGTVVESGSELIVETAQGQVTVGLGQASYREAAGFQVSSGDQVIVRGYDEDGEFKAGPIENVTTGLAITLRDSSGRPMWAGRGNLQNQP